MIDKDTEKWLRSISKSRKEELDNWIDRIKPYDSQALQQLREKFGDEAAKYAEECLKRFWGGITFGL